MGAAASEAGYAPHGALLALHTAGPGSLLMYEGSDSLVGAPVNPRVLSGVALSSTSSFFLARKRVLEVWTHVAVVLPINGVLHVVQPSGFGLHVSTLLDRVSFLRSRHCRFVIRRLVAEFSSEAVEVLMNLAEIVERGFQWSDEGSAGSIKDTGHASGAAEGSSTTGEGGDVEAKSGAPPTRPRAASDGTAPGCPAAKHDCCTLSPPAASLAASLGALVPQRVAATLAQAPLVLQLEVVRAVAEVEGAESSSLAVGRLRDCLSLLPPRVLVDMDRSVDAILAVSKSTGDRVPISTVLQCIVRRTGARSDEYLEGLICTEWVLFVYQRLGLLPRESDEGADAASGCVGPGGGSPSGASGSSISPSSDAGTTHHNGALRGRAGPLPRAPRSSGQHASVAVTMFPCCGPSNRVAPDDAMHGGGGDRAVIDERKSVGRRGVHMFSSSADPPLELLYGHLDPERAVAV